MLSVGIGTTRSTLIARVGYQIMRLKWYLIFIALLPMLLLSVMWITDKRQEVEAWRSLEKYSNPTGDRFDTSLIDHLPDAARRYFNFTIKPGTPLLTVVQISMKGELGLGDIHNPKYTAMSAKQILASPFGLVWQMQSNGLSGSDVITPNESWTRFWLYGIAPAVRIGDNDDHQRSAFGRVVAESVFWDPAALLPGEYVRWESVDMNTARAVVQFGQLEQAVDITVSDAGQPMKVVIQRWSNENSEKVYRYQPFGGYLSDFRDFHGYRLPTKVIGGNWIDTDDFFPFYKVQVENIRFMNAPEASGA